MMNSKIHYVYKVTDSNSGQFYIGSRTCECNPEEDSYMGSPYSWKPDIQNLKKEIIEDNFESREEAIEYEANLIEVNINDELNENYHIPNKGFHVTGLNWNLSEESKKNISDALKGRKFSDEHRKKISIANSGKVGELNSFYGKNHTEATKKLLKKVALERYKNPENHGMFNKKHSDKTKTQISNSRKDWWDDNPVAKTKMSKIHKGKKISKDTKYKISKSLSGEKNPMYGKTHSRQVKEKMYKRVQCLQENCCGRKIFRSITECSSYHDITGSSITYHIKGKSLEQKFKLIK